MFGFGKSKTDYRKICSNPKAVHSLLYDDRSKTAEILGDEAFIAAWLKSENKPEITRIINTEAIRGDVPSLKQMVWLLGNMQQKISAANVDKKRILPTLIGILGERISYCNVLISKGLLEQHYYAMVSAHQMYHALRDFDEPGTLEKTRDTLNEMVKHAQAVIKMGKKHPAFDGDAGIISDAENVLQEGEDLRKILNAMGDTISRFDEGR